MQLKWEWTSTVNRGNCHLSVAHAGSYIKPGVKHEEINVFFYRQQFCLSF